MVKTKICLLGNGANEENVTKNELDDSDVDAIQDLLQSSDSEIEWSDDELPRPKIN